MLGAWKVRLILAAVLAVSIAASVHAFVKQQRRIGAMQVLVKQEQQTRDSLALVSAAQAETLLVAHERIRALEGSAARATRRAVLAETRFADVVRTLDSAYALLADTTLVPLREVRIVRDAGILAVNACVASRDSVQLLADSLSSVCAQEKARNVTLAEQLASAERELSIRADTPTPPKGRWSFLRDVGIGAALVLVLKALGVPVL